MISSNMSLYIGIVHIYDPFRLLSHRPTQVQLGQTRRDQNMNLEELLITIALKPEYFYPYEDH